MTKQESFKKRVRARMARTGERYATARRALIARADHRGRRWISAPTVGDDGVRRGTGQDWEHWCGVIDGWSVEPWDHAAVAARLESERGVSRWWAQTVTVGYERITGLRLPYQMADGTFTANRSKTVAVDARTLRELLLDESHRRDLFPDEQVTLRSRPTTKTLRFAVGNGVALIELTPASRERTRVTVAHEKLPDLEDVERWRYWWAEWLEALDSSA